MSYFDDLGPGNLINKTIMLISDFFVCVCKYIIEFSKVKIITEEVEMNIPSSKTAAKVKLNYKKEKKW